MDLYPRLVYCLSCPAHSICPLLDEVANALVNGRWTDQLMQDNIGPASYWRDPYK
jgi:hypothetical protein